MYETEMEGEKREREVNFPRTQITSDTDLSDVSILSPSKIKRWDAMSIPFLLQKATRILPILIERLTLKRVVSPRKHMSTPPHQNPVSSLPFFSRSMLVLLLLLLYYLLLLSLTTLLLDRYSDMLPFDITASL